MDHIFATPTNMMEEFVHITNNYFIHKQLHGLFSWYHLQTSIHVLITYPFLTCLMAHGEFILDRHGSTNYNLFGRVRNIEYGWNCFWISLFFVWKDKMQQSLNKIYYCVSAINWHTSIHMDISVTCFTMYSGLSKDLLFIPAHPLIGSVQIG